MWRAPKSILPNPISSRHLTFWLGDNSRLKSHWKHRWQVFNCCVSVFSGRTHARTPIPTHTHTTATRSSGNNLSGCHQHDALHSVNCQYIFSLTDLSVRPLTAGTRPKSAANAASSVWRGGRYRKRGGGWGQSRAKVTLGDYTELYIHVHSEGTSVVLPPTWADRRRST